MSQCKTRHGFSPLKWVLSAAALFLTLAGCGGGGGGGGGTAGGGSGVNLFFTDNLSTGYDGVWVNVHKVELKSAAGSTTVFESAAGESINLRALGTPTGGRFLYLGPGSVPAGTYTGVEVITDRALTLVTTGSTTGTPATFAPALNEGADRSKLELPLAPPLVATGTSVDLVVDFDLASWTFAGGLVTPVLRRHSGEGLDDFNRHERDEYKGTIANLSGATPNYLFDLNRGTQVIKVKTDQTTIFEGRNGGAFTPANGKVAEVEGIFDVLAGVLVAKVVKEEDANDGGHGGDDSREDNVKGLVSEINAGAGTFALSGDFVRGFIPAARPIKIATTATTIYLAHRGTTMTKDAFFAAIAAAGSHAEAEGGYTEANNTLTARKVRLEDGAGEDHNEAEARGIASEVSSTTFTMTITVDPSEYEGFTLPASGKVNVVVTDSTEYKDRSRVSKEAFWAAVANGMTIKVNGFFEAGTITARKLEIRH